MLLYYVIYYEKFNNAMQQTEKVDLIPQSTCVVCVTLCDLDRHNHLILSNCCISQTYDCSTVTPYHNHLTYISTNSTCLQIKCF